MQPWDQFPFLLHTSATAKPDVAISACLNGEAVRYDGNSQTLETTSTILSKHLNLIPICPEVAAGATVPRPPIQLIKVNQKIEAIGRDDYSLNMTSSLQRVAQQSHQQLPEQLCAYILKSKSPSCGLNSTPIHNQQAEPIALGSGVQALYFSQQRPWLLFREEQQLQTHQACRQFILHCHILMDVQLASQQLSLSTIHTHYQFVIQQMSTTLQLQLERKRHSATVQDYGETLKRGLEKLGEIDFN